MYCCLQHAYQRAPLGHSLLRLSPPRAKCRMALSITCIRCLDASTARCPGESAEINVRRIPECTATSGPPYISSRRDNPHPTGPPLLLLPLALAFPHHPRDYCYPLSLPVETIPAHSGGENRRPSDRGRATGSHDRPPQGGVCENDGEGRPRDASPTFRVNASCRRQDRQQGRTFPSLTLPTMPLLYFGCFCPLRCGFGWWGQTARNVPPRRNCRISSRFVEASEGIRDFSPSS